MKLILVGTAQWGQNYGITNSQGRLEDQNLRELIGGLRSRGISSLDTAPGYGDSEARIGDFGRDFEVQTKISAMGKSMNDLEVELQESLTALKVQKVRGVLVHDWHLLSNRERESASDFLTSAQSRVAIERVGISAYEVDDLDSAFSLFEKLDVVQIPANVLDQRLVDSDAVTKLRANGGVIQARSLLLQGLLVGESFESHKSIHEAIMRFRQMADFHNRTYLEFAFDYIKCQEWIDEVIIAPTSIKELDEICDAWNSTSPDGISWESLASTDLNLIDPRRWV